MSRLLITLALTLCAGAAAAQTCQSVQLPALQPDQAVHLQGQASGDEMACFRLALTRGQNVSFAVVDGRGMVTTVPGM